MAKIEVRLNPDCHPTGSDLAFVNAARRSFNTRSDWGTEPVVWEAGDRITVSGDYTLKDKDKRLLEFLARGMTAADFEKLTKEIAEMGTELTEDFQEADLLVEKLWEWRNTPTHDTPFNHGFLSFEVKAPIFVRAQLVKHEYLIMSEFSRRYISDNVEFFIPESWRGKADDKKQGSVEFPLGPNGERTEPVEWLGVDAGTHDFYMEAYNRYKWMLDIGICEEQARMVLPQSTMTEWTWSGTFGAFAKMCQLRLAPDAQYETRLVAQQVYDFMEEYFPVSTPLLVKGVL